MFLAKRDFVDEANHNILNNFRFFFLNFGALFILGNSTANKSTIVGVMIRVQGSSLSLLALARGQFISVITKCILCKRNIGNGSPSS